VLFVVLAASPTELIAAILTRHMSTTSVLLNASMALGTFLRVQVGPFGEFAVCM